MNSNDYYSPPGSAYPSAVSTPQPIPENGEELYFQQRGMDMRRIRGLTKFQPWTLELIEFHGSAIHV